MGKKDHYDHGEVQKKGKDRMEGVRELLRKQSPLTVKQEKFCNNACVERFLRAKGHDSVKKTAKHLRACLAWRETLGIDHLIADEFAAELAEGVAYVAGHDDESRPVLIFRIKQDYQKFHSQKLFTRLLAFTLEVAISTMSKNVQQFVLLFDATHAIKESRQLSESCSENVWTALKMSSSFLKGWQGFFRSASAFMNLLLPALKIVADYYPGRLFKAFVIDPPSLFSYMWKGVRPFVELSTVTMMVSSLEFEDPMDQFSDFSAYSRAPSLRFDHRSVIKSNGKIGSCSSSRFSFTVSHHFDSLKPWYLTLTDASASKVGPTSPSSSSLGPARISPLNARSLSFASPVARATSTPRGNISSRKISLFPSTPLPQRTTTFADVIKPPPPRTPRPSFLQSPAMFFRKESGGRTEKAREAFMPLLKFYRRPYDEMVYRSKMRPPLGGLISIVKRRHVSLSQRF